MSLLLSTPSQLKSMLPEEMKLTSDKRDPVDAVAADLAAAAAHAVAAAVDAAAAVADAVAADAAVADRKSTLKLNY